MISSEEAFLVFRKWVDENTPLRFDGKHELLYNFSVAGTLESAVNEVVRLRLRDTGFIEIHLPEDTGFAFFDPDSMRVDQADRVGAGYKGERVTTGSGIVAIKQTGEEFLFIEVVRES